MSHAMSESVVLTNPFAPHLPTHLSEEAAQEVHKNRSGAERSPFATPDELCCRRYPVHRDESSAQRPAFVRDCEKIMHLPGYNRLAGKTQVFSFHTNDDISRRGLHVQLVARIARDIGAALGLNCDLIEAIALGHDIGHTPFGHAGERLLDAIYSKRTGQHFCHNANSLRVLDVLYGRNLSLQTLDGVLCHNGELELRELQCGADTGFEGLDARASACWSEGEKAVKKLRPITLEGCVVRLSDIIAYVGKDRQDAIRTKAVSPDVFADGLGGAYNTWALSAFSVDVIAHSLGQPRIQMSEEAFAELRRAKRENYELIYDATEINGQRAREIGELFYKVYELFYNDLQQGDERSPIFRHHIFELERELTHYGLHYAWQDNLDLTVVDFIASMTDDYFMGLCDLITSPPKNIFVSRGYFDGLDSEWIAQARRS